MNNQFVIHAGDNSLTFNQVQLHAGDEIIKPFYRYNKRTLREISENAKFKNAIAQAQQLANYNKYLDKPFGEFLKYLDTNGFERELSLFLNKHGNKRFREFYIKDHLSSKGLYAYKYKDEIVYLGRCCDNFNDRINKKGYGQISPRNCIKGGQSTNTKLNSFVLEHWYDITFWICPMNDCDTKIIENYEYQFFATNTKPKLNKSTPSKPKDNIQDPEHNQRATLMKFVAKNGEFYLQLLNGAHFKFVTKEGKNYIQRKAADEENGAMFQRLKQALRALNLSENDEKPFPLFFGEKMKTIELPDFEFEFKPLTNMSDRIKKLSFKADDQPFYLQKNPDAKPRFQFLDENSNPIIAGEKNKKKLQRLAIHLFGKSEVENLPANKKTNNALGYSIFKNFKAVNNEIIPLSGFQFKQELKELKSIKQPKANLMEPKRIKFKSNNGEFYLEENKSGTKYSFSKNIEGKFIIHEPVEDKRRGVLEKLARTIVGDKEIDSINIKNNNSLGPRIFKALKDELPCVVFLTDFNIGFEPIQ